MRGRSGACAIHEAGKDHAAGEIEFFGAARGAEFFDAAARADSGDAVFVNQDGAVADDAEFTEGFAAAGNGPAQSEELRAAGDQPFGTSIIGLYLIGL